MLNTSFPAEISASKSFECVSSSAGAVAAAAAAAAAAADAAAAAAYGSNIVPLAIAQSLRLTHRSARTAQEESTRGKDDGAFNFSRQKWGHWQVQSSLGAHQLALLLHAYHCPSRKEVKVGGCCECPIRSIL